MSKHKSGGGRIVPIIFLALIFGGPAARLAIRIARSVFRGITSGLSFGVDMLFDRTSILGSIAIGTIIGLVYYYRRRKQNATADEAEAEDTEEEEEPEAPFCPPIMTSTAAESTDSDYVPPMYHSSGS